MAAIAERLAAWVSGGMSWIASLIATWLKPQVRHSAMVTAIASASSGRDCGECSAEMDICDGGNAGSSVAGDPRRGAVAATMRQAPPSGWHHDSRQWEQMPAISITGLLGVKAAAPHDRLSASRSAE